MNNIGYLNTTFKEIIEQQVKRDNKEQNSKVVEMSTKKRNYFDNIKSKNEFYPTELADELLKIEQMRGNQWAYVAEKDKFYFYDNEGYWKDRNVRYLSELIRKILRLSNPKWDRKQKIREVILALQDLLLDSLNDDRFNIGNKPNKDLINLKNGMLYWKKDELIDHDPKYYSQIQFPIEYDPEATSNHWECAIKDWLPEKEARMFLQEYVGYCLIPDISMQKAVILTGFGSNGKSTFLEVIASLFGEKQLSHIPLHKLQNKFEIAYIEDKLVNICADIDSTYLKETGNVKTLIGGEMLRGEYKNGASFDFAPIARLFFSANELPTTSDKSFGWYRRLDIIEFPNTFSKQDLNFDPNLKIKLKEELPGIFNWALKGLRRLKSNNHFTRSEHIDHSNNRYRIKNDSVAAFVNDMVEFERSKYIVGADAYTAYKIYCSNEGLKYTSRKKFTTRLKQYGIISKVKHTGSRTERCYIGIKLKT